MLINLISEIQIWDTFQEANSAKFGLNYHELVAYRAIDTLFGSLNINFHVPN